jgi:outer membrane protein TolC
MHSLRKIQSILKENFVFIIFLTALQIQAQTSSVISLDEVKSKAKEKNTSLKISEQEYAFAKAQYESSSAVLLPQISLSNTSTFTNNPLYAFGFKLLQRDVTTSDFDPQLLNDPGNVENFNTRIELIQPLINLDGWKERKMANINAEASNLQMQRTEEYIELEATKTYMQLQLAYKSLSVMEMAKETAVQNQIWAKNNFDQGLMQSAAYLNMEVRVAEIEHKLNLATSNLQNVSDYLNFLIGAESGLLLSPNDELILDLIATENNSILSMNRKDILAMQYSVDAQEKMLESSKMNFVPRANAVANYEWNDDSFGGFGANNYMIGLQLSWDIFSGYKNIGKIHQEKALLEKASLTQQKYIHESELELSKARRQFADSKNQVELTGLALEQSKEAFRITSNRFKQGLEKSTDLLYSETKYHEKELEHAKAIFNYNFSKAYLNFLTI